MALPHQNNVARGVVNGGYVPTSIFQYQEHQRQKLKTEFRNRSVFSETKIQPTTVNKSVTKNSRQVLPSFVTQQQDNKVNMKAQATFVSEKNSDYSNKVQQHCYVIPKTYVVPKTTDTSPHRDARRRSFELLVGSKREYEIGQQYLADCGISTQWVYKCASHHNLPICVENESDGAWVPFITLYRTNYYDCLYVKEHGQGREFNQDHGTAYS